MCALFRMRKQKVSKCHELGALPWQCWCERRLAELALARLNLQLPNPTERRVNMRVSIVPVQVQVCRPVALSPGLCLGQEAEHLPGAPAAPPLPPPGAWGREQAVLPSSEGEGLCGPPSSPVFSGGVD